MRCSSGTYIRAIARDVGAALGVGGHLTALRRTAVGSFDLAVGPHPRAARRRLRGAADRRRRPRERSPALDLDEDAGRRRAGRSGARPRRSRDGPTAVFAPDGEFLALYEPRRAAARPVAVFVCPRVGRSATCSSVGCAGCRSGAPSTTCPADLGRTVVTIGNFDGVHLGHRARAPRARARGRRARHRTVVAVTFDPHPMAVLRPEHAPPTLTTIETRAGLLDEAGVDDVLVDRRSTARSRPGRRRSSSTGSSSTRCTPGRSWSAPTSASAHQAAGDVATLRRGGGVARLRGRSASRSTADRRCGARPTSATAWPPVTSPAPRRRWAGRSPSAASWSRATSAAASSATRPPTCPITPVDAAPADGVYAGWLTRLDTGETYPAAISRRHQPDLRRRAGAPGRVLRPRPRRPRALRRRGRGRVRRPAARHGRSSRAMEALVETMHDDVRRARELLAPDAAPSRRRAPRPGSSRTACPTSSTRMRARCPRRAAAPPPGLPVAARGRPARRRRWRCCSALGHGRRRTPAARRCWLSAASAGAAVYALDRAARAADRWRGRCAAPSAACGCCCRWRPGAAAAAALRDVPLHQHRGVADDREPRTAACCGSRCCCCSARWRCCSCWCGCPRRSTGSTTRSTTTCVVRAMRRHAARGGEPRLVDAADIDPPEHAQVTGFERWQPGARAAGHPGRPGAAARGGGVRVLHAVRRVVMDDGGPRGLDRRADARPTRCGPRRRRARAGAGLGVPRGVLRPLLHRLRRHRRDLPRAVLHRGRELERAVGMRAVYLALRAMTLTASATAR